MARRPEPAHAASSENGFKGAPGCRATKVNRLAIQTAATTTKAPKVGDRAPPLELITGKDAGGNATVFRLADAVKKGPTIVAFFPGAFTGTCTNEMACFTREWDQYAKLGAQFIGVSVDSPVSQKAFAEKNNYKVAFGSDFEKKAIRDWGVEGKLWWGTVAKRATFVVDRNGVVRYAHVQADAGQEPPYAEIKAALQKAK